MNLFILSLFNLFGCVIIFIVSFYVKLEPTGIAIMAIFMASSAAISDYQIMHMKGTK